MRKITAIFIMYVSITLAFSNEPVYAQFTKKQIDELTAFGISSAIEHEHRAVVERSLDVTKNYRGSYNILQVAAIFDHVYRGWNYSRDPFGLEHFEKAGVSVYTMTGDCDDYAILMVSMLKSLGGEGRIVCVSGHAYPEVYLGKDLAETDIEEYREKLNEYYQDKGSRTRVKHLNYHRDKDGTCWMNMDYQDRYPGGRFVEYSRKAEHLVIYSDGSYKLAYLNDE
jgi:transglutaminase-like putative cysteine protease